MEDYRDKPTDTNNYNPNQTTIGNYILEARIGGGEHSATFRGIDAATRDTVAIKVMSKSLPVSETLYEAEKNAYKSLKGLPGILQLKDNGENDEDYFLVTEFIPDGSLRDILKKHAKGMNIREVIHLFTPVAEAIDHIHKKNIIHRDLKPENILVRNTNDG